MSVSKILDKFLPPQFLEVPQAALVFSDSSVRGMYIDKTGKKTILHKEINLEPGVIEAGKIINGEKLTKTLEQLKSDLPTPFVRFTIPDGNAYVFTAKVPVSPGKSAEESVAFILEENVPLPLGEASFDFEPVSVEKTGNGYYAEIVATAVSSALVGSYVQVVRNAGLEPLLCVNESQAIARSVIPDGSKNAAIICYLHQNSIGIYVARGQTIEFSSIAAATDKSFIQTVVSELTTARKYWEEHKSKNEAEVACILCGRDEMCDKALGEVNKLEGIRASLANVWTNAFSLDEYLPEVSFEDSLKYASAIGLLI